MSTKLEGRNTTRIREAGPGWDRPRLLARTTRKEFSRCWNEEMTLLLSWKVTSRHGGGRRASFREFDACWVVFRRTGPGVAVSTR